MPPPAPPRASAVAVLVSAALSLVGPPVLTVASGPMKASTLPTTWALTPAPAPASTPALPPTDAASALREVLTAGLELPGWVVSTASEAADTYPLLPTYARVSLELVASDSGTMTAAPPPAPPSARPRVQ